MPFGKTHKPEKIWEDIDELGYPEVVINHHGGTLKLVTEGCTKDAMHIRLYSGDSFCDISLPRIKE